MFICILYNDYLKTVVSHRRQQQTLIYNFPATDATAAVLLKKRTCTIIISPRNTL